MLEVHQQGPVDRLDGRARTRRILRPAAPRLPTPGHDGKIAASFRRAMNEGPPRKEEAGSRSCWRKSSRSFSICCGVCPRAPTRATTRRRARGCSASRWPRRATATSSTRIGSITSSRKSATCFVPRARSSRTIWRRCRLAAPDGRGQTSSGIWTRRLSRPDPGVARSRRRHAEAWLSVLNQARLVIAARRGFGEREMDEDLPFPPFTERDLDLFRIHFFDFHPADLADARWATMIEH